MKVGARFWRLPGGWEPFNGTQVNGLGVPKRNFVSENENQNENENENENETRTRTRTRTRTKTRTKLCHCPVHAPTASASSGTVAEIYDMILFDMI